MARAVCQTISFGTGSALKKGAWYKAVRIGTRSVLLDGGTVSRIDELGLDRGLPYGEPLNPVLAGVCPRRAGSRQGSGTWPWFGQKHRIPFRELPF
jgi:hypothetical protein